MLQSVFLVLAPILLIFAYGTNVAAQDEKRLCVECHSQVTPRVVSDWKLSKHSRNDVYCPSCHGYEHTSRDDVEKAQLALPQKCAECHQARVEQFKKGKHALAWTAMNAMPTVHWQPMAQVEGLKGCGSCHRIGIKTEEEVRDLETKGSGFGASSCDACHTRHVFSTEEAKSPQACQTCHMGMDHPQWEMFSTSKHGTRYLLKQSRVIPETVAAPTCQTCHMREGSHSVRTAWGFLAVRLPMSEDPSWTEDRTTILQALGVLDPSGNPTPRMNALMGADVMRRTLESWQDEREKMIKVCNQCHSVNFARSELAKGDQMVREADRLMASAIRTIAGLYSDGILAKSHTYAHNFPDVLAFGDAPTMIEQRLFKMFSEYRMRAFQGSFHASPAYAYWYGWSPLQTTLTEINERAAALRQGAPPPEESKTEPKGQQPPARSKRPAVKK